MNEPIRIAVHGAAGRMGRRLIALAGDDAHLRLIAAVDRADHPDQGRDAGELAGVGEMSLPLSSELPLDARVVIDFSLPEAVAEAVRHCRDAKCGLVVATTGLADETQTVIDEAAGEIPILQAPSMSLAVNLTMRLSQIAGKALKDHAGGVDVEIIERHHRFKEDAPSGTALRFGEIVAEAMQLSQHVHGREGRTGARTRDEIGYHAVRVGDNPGEHTIVFGMLGETIELKVAASNRDCYATGALAAAKFLYGQSPGKYGMDDVLGF